MSGFLEIGGIELPAGKRAEVEALLKECELDELLTLAAVPGRLYLEPFADSTAWGTITEVEEKFFPGLAKILKGTDEDGQIITHVIDDARDWHILINGENKEYAQHEPIELRYRDSALTGMLENAIITVKVLTLGRGRAAIVEYPK